MFNNMPQTEKDKRREYNQKYYIKLKKKDFVRTILKKFCAFLRWKWIIRAQKKERNM